MPKFLSDQFLSNRQKSRTLGILSKTEDTTVLSVIGGASISGDLDAQDIIKGYKYTVAPYSGTTTTLVVTVSSKVSGEHRYYGQGSSQGYVIDGLQSPFFTFTPGNTYRFDQSDNSNSNHQIYITNVLTMVIWVMHFRLILIMQHN